MILGLKGFKLRSCRGHSFIKLCEGPAVLFLGHCQPFRGHSLLLLKTSKLTRFIENVKFKA